MAATKGHLERVRERLIEWTNSPQNQGRTRLRGGRRGAPTPLQTDTFDARTAFKSMERAIESLEKAADETRPPSERDEHWRVALGQLGLAGRSIDEIVLRPHTALFSRRGPA